MPGVYPLARISGYLKVRTADVTANEGTAPVIAATPPTGMIPTDDFFGTEIIPYGKASGSCALALWGIRRVDAAGAPTVMYVPVKVATVTVLLGTLAGLAGGLVDETYRFGDTFSVALAQAVGSMDYLANMKSGNSGFVALAQHSPGGNLTPAAIGINSNFNFVGWHIQFVTLTTMTAVNALYGRWA